MFWKLTFAFKAYSWISFITSETFTFVLFRLPLQTVSARIRRTFRAVCFCYQACFGSVCVGRAFYEENVCVIAKSFQNETEKIQVFEFYSKPHAWIATNRALRAVKYACKRSGYVSNNFFGYFFRLVLTWRLSRLSWKIIALFVTIIARWYQKFLISFRDNRDPMRSNPLFKNIWGISQWKRSLRIKGNFGSLCYYVIKLKHFCIIIVDICCQLFLINCK